MVVLDDVPAAKELAVVGLRVESLVEPLAVDAERPLLGWRLTGGGFNVSQSAYQVRVASDPALFRAGRPDLWDSGHVADTTSTGIRYGGERLSPGRFAYWQVRVWDQAGRVSAWSDVASWGAGLGPDGWRDAEWIGLDTLPDEIDGAAPVSPQEEGFGAAAWILESAGENGTLPEGEWLYETRFTLPADAAVHSATLWVIADDEHRSVLNGAVVAEGTSWRAHQRVEVGEQLRRGGNVFRVLVRNSAPGYSGVVAHLIVTLTDGSVVRIATDERWRVTARVPDGWEDAERLEGLGRCVAYTAYGGKPWDDVAQALLLRLDPPRYMRSEFRVTKSVRRAVLYSTALGASDVYLNGERINPDYLAPGWTDYRKRVYYHSYDVTGRVARGANAVGIVLADGWYSGYVGQDEQRDHYGTRPRAAMQLHLEFSDGTRRVVATGRGWHAHAGPLRYASMLMGEYHDATQELHGWAGPGYDAEGWRPVDRGTVEVSPTIEAAVGPPVVEIERFPAQSITEPEPGVYLFDLGQNFAGVAELRVSGRTGQAVTLRYGEMLNPDGSLYTANLRQARATDTYICRGGGVEVWSPRFTFHGFRYVEVSGLEDRPDLDMVTGIAIGSDTRLHGAFDSSSPLLNTLARNVYWTQRSNFLSVPSDCPQRDERLGWTGDAQVYIRTAALWCDVQPFFRKWLTDLVDAQYPGGEFPWTAPTIRHVTGVGGPAWMDAGTVCPWAMYQVYGDTQTLERLYVPMKRLVAHYRREAGDDLLPPEDYHCFGDWLSMGESTPNDVIYMTYFAHSTRLTAKAARVLGYDAEAELYEQLLEAVLEAFDERYVDEAGVIEGDTQTCYALAIVYDMLSAEKAPLASGHLVRRIEAMNDHLSTGFVGTKDLLLALAKAGRNDVAYRLVMNETYPSWGFSIRHGATTIWERWDGWTPERGFQTTIMNSFSHYAFGAVYQWMVENIGGIRLIQPGFRRFQVAPQPSDALTYADVRYRSIYGTIRSRWETDASGRLVMAVVVPPNTRAELVVPGGGTETMTINGLLPTDSDIPGLIYQGGNRLEVGSGTYEIIAE